MTQNYKEKIKAAKIIGKKVNFLKYSDYVYLDCF